MKISLFSVWKPSQQQMLARNKFSFVPGEVADKVQNVPEKIFGPTVNFGKCAKGKKNGG